MSNLKLLHNKKYFKNNMRNSEVPYVGNTIAQYEYGLQHFKPF